MLYVAVDGTGVPVMPAATHGRAGKAEDGKARTREVKLACSSPRPPLDNDGFPVRDPDSSSYLATFDARRRFGQLVDAEARRRGADTSASWSSSATARPGSGTSPTSSSPQATQIVDLYHAREHVHELATLAARLCATASPAGSPQRLAELDAGDIPALLPPAATCVSPAPWPANATGPWATSRTTPTACATSTSAHSACSSARAPSKPAAKRHRPAAQAVRHALDRPRRCRHRHPALPGSQQPLGPDLAATPQPDSTRRPGQTRKLILLPTKLAHTHIADALTTSVCA